MEIDDPWGRNAQLREARIASWMMYLYDAIVSLPLFYLERYSALSKEKLSLSSLKRLRLILTLHSSSFKYSLSIQKSAMFSTI